MWTHKRNLVLTVSFILLLLVLVGASYFLYKNWQKNKRLDEARIQRETILHDLVNIEYKENMSIQERKAIKDSLLLMGQGKNEPKMTESEKSEILNTLIQAPQATPNE